MGMMIRPVHDNWNTGAATDVAIAAWERSAGLRLPDDYRAFMLGYDGGRPYPNIFRHTARDPQGFPNPSEHYLDPFYGAVVDKTRFKLYE